MFQKGDKIGLYTLIQKLGKGGFGEVWLAERTSEGFRKFTKKVAVKLPLDEQINFKAIEQEATLWEEASGNANVLPIIDADIYNGQVVIVSEYADGGSLADKLQREGKFSVKKAVETTIGILNGLEYLHAKKIIHRDIKPQNILLQGDTPRLADFGISRAMNTMTVSSQVVGTDAYMSPEALDGKRNVQTDVWSVGVVLYELLTDDLPFPQEHPSERMYAIIMKEFAPLSGDIPQSLRDVLNKALAKKPKDRYKSAEAMKHELAVILSEITHKSITAERYLSEHTQAETLQISASEIQNAFATKKDEADKSFQPRTLLQSSGKQSDLTESAFPTEPFKLVETSSTGKRKKSAFIYIGAALAGLFAVAIGIGAWLFNKTDATNNAQNNNIQTTTVNPKVLDADRISVKILKGYFSNEDKFVVDMYILGVGAVSVMEELRKPGNINIEFNETQTTVTSEIVNGTMIKVRAEGILASNEARYFRSGEVQTLVIDLLLKLNENDQIAKTVNTPIQKEKNKKSDQPNLGESVSFGVSRQKDVTQISPKINKPKPSPTLSANTAAMPTPNISTRRVKNNQNNPTTLQTPRRTPVTNRDSTITPTNRITTNRANTQP